MLCLHYSGTRTTRQPVQGGVFVHGCWLAQLIGQSGGGERSSNLDEQIHQVRLLYPTPSLTVHSDIFLELWPNLLIVLSCLRPEKDWLSKNSYKERYIVLAWYLWPLKKKKKKWMNIVLLLFSPKSSLKMALLLCVCIYMLIKGVYGALLYVAVCDCVNGTDSLL